MEYVMKFSISMLAAIAIAYASLAHGTMAFADTKGCPPGLAKKNPPCIPPGQAKKGATVHQSERRYHMGDVVDRDDLTYLDDYAPYNLPPLRNGQRYAVVNDQIVVIDADTFAILQLIRIFTTLAD